MIFLVWAGLTGYAQTNANFFYNTASNDFATGNYRAAAAGFNRALSINPQNADAYCYRGMCKWWLQDYQGAVADYDRAIQLNPRRGGYYCDRGQAEFSLKKTADALADYNTAIQFDSQNAQAYYNRGALQFLCLSNYTAAAADFSQAIELHNDPAEEDIFFWRGNARMELKDYAGAATDYAAAIHLNPNGQFALDARKNLTLAAKPAAKPVK